MSLDIKCLIVLCNFYLFCRAALQYFDIPHNFDLRIDPTNLTDAATALDKLSLYF